MYLTVYGMNKFLFDKIYFFTLHNERFKKAAVFVSEFSKPAFIFIYIAAIAAVIIKGEGIVKILTVPFFTLLFNTILRKILNKPRPFLRDDVIKLTEHKNSGSFPSNHACSSVIISLCYILVFPPLVPLFMLFSFFTGLSRVATGVHYPADVFAGWSISLLSGIIFFIFF